MTLQRSYRRHVYTTLLFPLKFIARFILFSMGWQLLHNSILNRITEYDKSVLVFSHTSYSDFYILMLYLLAYPYNLSHIKTLVKPQPFAYAGKLLRAFGAIPATRVDDKNGGAVSRIVTELKQFDKFAFLISPKGSIIKREWRSGYYYIAKNLQANLIAVGLDYEKKCVIFSPDISYTKSEENIRNFLREQLKEIVPLFPDEEVVPIRSHDATKRGIVNIQRLIVIISSIIIIGLTICYFLTMKSGGLPISF